MIAWKREQKYSSFPRFNQSFNFSRMTFNKGASKKRNFNSFASAGRANRGGGRGGGSGFYKKRFGGGGTRATPSSTYKNGGEQDDLNVPAAVDGSVIRQRFQDIAKLDSIDEALGFPRYTTGMAPSKYGWLVNMHSTLVKDPDWAGGRSAVDLYFIQEDGSCFKSSFISSPYFFVVCKVIQKHHYIVLSYCLVLSSRSFQSQLEWFRAGCRGLC